MLFSLAAFALSPGITVPSGSYSLPELAAALTKAGMPVEAAASVSARAAYVCLEERSPEEVKRLLAEALDVQFESRQGRLLMIYDPAAKERDRRFLAAYSKLAGDSVRNWQRTARESAGDRGYEEFAQSVRVAAENAGDIKDPAVFSKMVRSMTLVQPPYWTVAHQATLPGVAVKAVADDVSDWTTLAATGLPPSTYAPAYDKPVDLESPFEYRMTFEPEEGLLSIDAFLHGEYVRSPAAEPIRARANGFALQMGGGEGTVNIAVEPQGVEETFKALGPEAASYLAGMSPRADLPEGEPLKVPLQNISKALESIGHEGVMELSPHFEDVPRAELWQNAPSVTPKSLFTPTPLQRLRGVDPTFYVFPKSQFEKEIRWRAERRFPLRVVDRKGVWVVRNPYGFLDRARFVSPVPFLRAERLLAELPADTPRDFGGNLMFTWDMAVKLYKAVRPETTLRETQKTFNYRGVSIHQASLLEPIIPIVEGMSPTVRKNFWATLASTGKAVINDSAGPITITSRPFQKEQQKASFVLEIKRVPSEKPINTTAFIDGRGSLVP